MMFVSVRSKKILIDHILDLLEEKISLLVADNASVQESSEDEIKSSAGDKFETGREMMQIELDKNNVRLMTLLKQKKELLQIDTHARHQKAQVGSLVVTDYGKYFISIGLGELIVNDDKFYVISLNSPIGKMLYGKKSGDQLTFNNRTFSIDEIH